MPRELGFADTIAQEGCLQGRDVVLWRKMARHGR
jgi:hypothetical protein